MQLRQLSVQRDGLPALAIQAQLAGQACFSSVFGWRKLGEFVKLKCCIFRGKGLPFTTPRGSARKMITWDLWLSDILGSWVS